MERGGGVEVIGVNIPNCTFVSGFPVPGYCVVVIFETPGIVSPLSDCTVKLPELMGFVIVPGFMGFMYPVVHLHTSVFELPELLYLIFFMPELPVFVFFHVHLIFKSLLLNT